MTQSPLSSRRKCKNLTNKERLHLFQLLLKDFNGKKLKQGTIKKYAEEFSICTKTVSSIWKLGAAFIATGDPVDVSNKRSKRVGRKRIEIDPEKVKLVGLRCRKTIIGLSNAIGMSKSTLHRRYKEGNIRRHSNAIKPKLTEGNMKEIIKYCLSMLDIRIYLNGSRLEVDFKGMFDHVMIDEKWFFMTKNAEHYYLTSDEAEPQRTCQSKRFITKVMFLAIVARPRFNELGDCVFDGKIGLFPFIDTEEAKRKSKNRPAGTLEMKPILSITKDITRSWLINKVLPAIRERWPSSSRDSPIYIQQDNARPHVDPLDVQFIEASRLLILPVISALCISGPALYWKFKNVLLFKTTPPSCNLCVCNPSCRNDPLKRDFRHQAEKSRA